MPAAEIAQPKPVAIRFRKLPTAVKAEDTDGMNCIIIKSIGNSNNFIKKNTNEMIKLKINVTMSDVIVLIPLSGLFVGL